MFHYSQIPYSLLSDSKFWTTGDRSPSEALGFGIAEGIHMVVINWLSALRDGLHNPSFGTAAGSSNATVKHWPAGCREAPVSTRTVLTQHYHHIY